MQRLTHSMNTRIIQVMGLIVLSLFVAEFTQWQQGLWIAISVTAIVGPFATNLSLEKARNRVIGTLAGLLLATLLQVYLRYDYQTLFLVGILIAYWIGFSIQQNYRFFIMAVTVAVCLNYGYMNLAFTSFEPWSFLVARFMCVMIGVALFLLVQKYLYGSNNAQAELMDCTRILSNQFTSALGQLVDNESRSSMPAIEVAIDLSKKSAMFNAQLAAAQFSLNEKSNALIIAQEFDFLRHQVLSALLDLSGCQYATDANEHMTTDDATIKQKLSQLRRSIDRFSV